MCFGGVYIEVGIFVVFFFVVVFVLALCFAFSLISRSLRKHNKNSPVKVTAHKKEHIITIWKSIYLCT